MTAERDKLLLELGDLRALRAAMPAPPSDHIGDATELVWERAALIAQLSNDDADMLRRKWFGHRNTGHLSFVEAVDATMEGLMAQQVGDHNLFSPTEADVRIEDVSRAMATRGNVMEITVNNAINSPPFKLADMAANDAGLLDVQGKIANGELQPTAPCDGMYSEWTAEQKEKLDLALGTVFGWV